MVETLIRQTRNADIFKREDGLMRARVGVVNARPFESDGDYRTQIMDRADKIAPGIWRYKNADMGFTVDMNNRRIRVHPVRGFWDDYYYQIDVPGTEPFRFNPIHLQLIELYIDGPDERESFYLTPRGLKIITIAKNAKARSIHKYNISAKGLSRNGRELVTTQAGRTVAIFPRAVLWDSSPERIYRPVMESFKNGVLTLEADYSGLTFPVFKDPSLLNITPDIDATFWGRAGFQNLNYGADETRMFSLASVIGCQCHQWDLSALGIDTVTSAQMFCYQHGGLGYSSGVNFRATVLSESMLVEGTGTWAGGTTDGVSWNYRDNLITPWSTPGGTPGAASVIYMPAAWPVWHSPIVTSLVQEAVDNYSSMVTIKTCFDGYGGNNFQVYLRSKEYFDSAYWPYLDIIYTLPVGNVPPHIFQRVR